MSWQLSGFQRTAFQIGYSAGNQASNVGDYGSHYHRQRERYLQERTRKEKSDLQKLESVLKEAQRKQELAAKNKLVAQAQQAARLAQLELEYLQEINRLLMVRAELIRRIQEDEAILIILITSRKRRLRVA